MEDTRLGVRVRNDEIPTLRKVFDLDERRPIAPGTRTFNPSAAGGWILDRLESVAVDPNYKDKKVRGDVIGMLTEFYRRPYFDHLEALQRKQEKRENRKKMLARFLISKSREPNPTSLNRLGRLVHDVSD